MSDTKTLALDDASNFTIAGFVRQVFAQVPVTVSREKILATLEGLQDTYTHPDLQKRFSFFADDIVIEDPAGLVRGVGRAGMEAFFRSTFDNGVRILRNPVDRIIVGGEALERSDMTLEKDGLEPTTLPHYALYRFNDQGLITSLRVFFDLTSIGR